VLGAGASRASGIPTGGELVKRWLSELHERLAEQEQPLETWATAENLGIKGFDYAKAASFYPRVYERRYSDHPEEGFACLEELMAGKEPSPGYSILAKVMEDERHRVVITTNFDNLVADALAIYTDTYPFVCGHEALTGFVRTAMRRPLVCKIHRDLLLGPKNDSRSLKRLHDAWASALRPLLAQYTPVFIGYGGNDDSLMDLLESLEPGEIKGQLVWCYYEKDEPSDRIKALVLQHRGVLVPVPDFDLFMILLGSELGIEPLDVAIEERAKQRVENYRKRILALDTTNHPAVATALASTLERAGGWLAVELKAKNELDLDKREKIYQQGLQQFPQSSEVHSHFANFLTHVRYRPEEAEVLYRKAMELDPQDPIVINDLAVFLDAQRNFPEAERLYKAALGIVPNRSSDNVYYANFLTRLNRNDEANQYYQRALQLAPKDPPALMNYALFQAIEMGRFDEANRLMLKAQKLAPIRYIFSMSAAILLLQGNLQEAANAVEKAMSLNQDEEISQRKAKLDFYAALVERCQNRDDTAALIQLKTLLRKEFLRYSWLFSPMLQAVKPHLSDEEFKFYTALADAIHDSKAVPNLESFERWRSLSSAA
jgi:protein O-mannosyl-transferase